MKPKTPSYFRPGPYPRKRRVIRIILGTAIALVSVYGVLVLSAKPIAGHSFFSDNRFLVIAHRGGGGLWPENTLYAFRKALDIGVDVLEMDIRSMADGVLMVLHDKDVDRTTNGRGPVNGFLLKELKELDAGYRWTRDNRTFPFRGKGITVPTLKEVFHAFPKSRMSIEIKQAQPSVISPLCRMLRKYRMNDKVIVGSFHDGVIGKFRETCPEVATSTGAIETQLFYLVSLAFLESAYSPSVEALQVPEYSGGLHVLTRRFVRAARGRNMVVTVWVVDAKEDMRRLLGIGVNGIITDFPDRLLAELER